MNDIMEEVNRRCAHYIAFSTQCLLWFAMYVFEFNFQSLLESGRLQASMKHICIEASDVSWAFHPSHENGTSRNLEVWFCSLRARHGHRILSLQSISRSALWTTRIPAWKHLVSVNSSMVYRGANDMYCPSELVQTKRATGICIINSTISS